MTVDVREIETHRVPLMGHCYRMLGSALEAGDAVQETMVRAWRGAQGFEGRSSLRTWLYRIATNVCLDALADKSRRVRPIDDGPAGGVDDPIEQYPHSHWIEPIPDALVLPASDNPGERAVMRESVRLAFVAALQLLPPKQRAALLLTEVLGWSAAEAAVTLDTSVASLNSALQRARSTLGDRGLKSDGASLSGDAKSLVDKYVDAFERYDVETLTALLTEDAILNMPPMRLWLQGSETLRNWWLGRGSGCRGSRLVPAPACGSPAFGQYRQGGKQPWSLIVLELTGDRIATITNFLDTKTLFPLFGLPETLQN
jgi:RNA polymerase sigma-70 factor, ECF subfamily